MIIRHEPALPSSREAPTTPSHAVASVQRRSRFRLIFSSTTLAILASVLLFPSLFYPLARDQGVFAYVGSLILKGAWPYRDVWELKPPGIYYTYAAILGCGGHSIFAVRAFDLLAAAATVLLLRASLDRFVSREAAWLGALLYAALYLRLGFWGMAQAESYANLWAAAALLLWLQASGVQAFRRSGVRAFRRSGGTNSSVLSEPASGALTGQVMTMRSLLAGTAAAAALLLKVTSLPPLFAAVGVVSLLRIHEEEWRLEARRLVVFVAGLLVPLALVAAIMAHSGAGAAYLDIQRGFVTGYVALPSAGAAGAGWRYCWHLYSLPVLLAAGGLWTARPPTRLFLGAWLAAAIGSVIMQRK
jgi:hypothetical protein